MKTPKLTPLSPELQRLLDAERSRPEPEPESAMQRRVLARLQQSVFSAAPLVSSQNGRGAASSSWLRHTCARLPGSMALLLAGALGGAAAHAWLRPDAPKEDARMKETTIVAPFSSPRDGGTGAPAPTAVPVTPRQEDAPAPRGGAPSTPPASRSNRRSSPPPGTSAARGSATVTAPAPSTITDASSEPSTPERARILARDDDLAAERALIDRARTAVGRGKISHALEALTEHRRRFPEGQLVEEREALRILALAADGHLSEARRLAAEFRRLHPQSLLLRAIDSTLDGTTSE